MKKYHFIPRKKKFFWKERIINILKAAGNTSPSIYCSSYGQCLERYTKDSVSLSKHYPYSMRTPPSHGQGCRTNDMSTISVTSDCTTVRPPWKSTMLTSRVGGLSISEMFSTLAGRWEVEIQHCGRHGACYSCVPQSSEYTATFFT